MEKKKRTCRKQFHCNVEGCEKPHRRNGYCANHSQQYKNGTLGVYPHSKLCTVDGCFKKHFSKGMCIAHYGRIRSAKQRKIDNEKITGVLKEGTNTSKMYRSSESVKRIVRRTFGDKCMECGWDKAACDGHHIIPSSQGGLNTIENIVILCPNCHRLAHRNILTVERLKEIHPTSVEPKELQQ